MVLNALHIDPGRQWKGPWRWFHEELLDCCKDLGVILRINGHTSCLARAIEKGVERETSGAIRVQKRSAVTIASSTRRQHTKPLVSLR